MKVLHEKGLLFLLGLLAIASPARAKDLDRQTAANQKTPIAVEVGAGHTIDFSKTGEQVFRGWIGDGGRCLQLSPSSPLETGASIIYLRRITPCQQVTGLPVVGETTLTLATLSPAGESNIYEFSIDYSATGESLTRLMPREAPAVTTAASPAQVFLLSPRAVAAGLATFDLASDSPVAVRVAAWLTAIEEGQGQRLAARSAQVDWALLQRLEEIGRNNLIEEGALST